MDIRQLKAFVAVFEERNITAAAQRLHITQPTLSVTIRQLEESLQTSLFERQARGVAVSEAARLLYPQARRLLAQAQQLQTQFRQRNSCLPLTLGVEEDVADSHIEALLRFARQQVPGLLLSVQPGCSGEARLAAEENRCEDELFLPLWEELYQLAVSAEVAANLPAAVDITALAELDWITCPDHPSHQRLLAMHGEHGVALTLAARAGSLRLARQMVAAGLGVALLPLSLLQGQPGVRALPLLSPTLSRRIGLCYAAQALDSPALQWLHKQLAAQGMAEPA